MPVGSLQGPERHHAETQHVHDRTRKPGGGMLAKNRIFFHLKDFIGVSRLFSQNVTQNQEDFIAVRGSLLLVIGQLSSSSCGDRYAFATMKKQK